MTAEQIRVEIGKLMADTTKINTQARWYPIVVAGGIIAATATIVILLGS